MTPIKNMNNEYVLKRVKVQNDSGVQSQIKSQLPKGPSFGDVLKHVQDKDHVKFSKHAMQRLSDRNIKLSDSEMDRINDAVGKAKNKGVREALILMDNKVFVASVKNNTIITAAVDEQLKDNVFTNIDGAVIV